MKVFKMAKAIKEGRIKLDKAKIKKEIYLLWEDGGPVLPAPKLPLPGHAESYNPPPEYLFTKEEEKKYEEEGSPYNFTPQKFDSLRKVPGYKDFVKERFDRCLDLYLAPRTLKKKINIKPDQLLPNLPNINELKPFPNYEVLKYINHTSRIRTISINPNGTYLLSGSEDGVVNLWEVQTTKLIKSWKFNGIIQKLLWNPNPLIPLFAVALNDEVLLCDPHLYKGERQDKLDELLNKNNLNKEIDQPNNKVKWFYVNDVDNNDNCVRMKIQHSFPVKSLSWHSRGDYLASLCPSGISACVCIHQLSRRRSQFPFKKNKGEIQCVEFHPNKPIIIISNKTHIRIYNLLQQILIKKLRTPCKWISSMTIHPSGDHLVISSYDKKVCWFDFDLSSEPYKILNYHKKAVRSVKFHSSYPLLATASDDGTIHIFHTMVYSDFLKNPLIVPLKVLRGHEVISDIGVMDIIFHPNEPWIFTCGADHSIRLYHSM